MPCSKYGPFVTGVVGNKGICYTWTIQGLYSLIPLSFTPFFVGGSRQNVALQEEL